jgi:hypothetical protein
MKREDWLREVLDEAIDCSMEEVHFANTAIYITDDIDNFIGQTITLLESHFDHEEDIDKRENRQDILDDLEALRKRVEAYQ